MKNNEKPPLKPDRQSSNNYIKTLKISELIPLGHTRVYLEHENTLYILQITQNNRLILTK
ncbi:hemin uptake protein HemP [Limnobacter sp.]|uniref:hemin uptake protein HemP n=1 Tax=Limnobacter sp. TaxID=2003368 RepID=UPI0039C9FA83